jgi:glc operon protein GlcG
MSPACHESLRARLVLASAAAGLAVVVGGSAQALPAGPVTIPKQSITLSAARAMIDASVAHAETLALQEVIVVDDESGTVKAAVAMDGALLTSVNFAHDKAYTAAVRRVPTQDLADRFANLPAFMLESFMKQQRLTMLGGGIPIVVDGQVVGGIGTSGGTIPQDIEVAEAGLAALRR